ncbi:MAG: divalent-cation tolerance protein CutA [Deltaproteobacteria bacterium]|nr:divalent-cation tolerance protein CutA [Deltaproteobacteria bacterium]
MGGGHIIVFMTAPNQEEGAAIGRKAVEEGLAACCNIVPKVRSIYTWKGKVCDEEEALCVFKTRAALFDALKERIKGLHSYEVPEIVAVEISAGLEAYLGWIYGATGGV